MRFVQAAVMLIGAVAYVLVVTSYDALTPENYQLALLLTIIGWNTLLIIVSVLVIVDSVVKVRKGKTDQLATGVFIVKLASIPFFIINFVLMATLGTLGTLVFAFLGLAAVILVVVLTYLAMISTSIYGWAAIIQLRRERRIDTALSVLYTILLFIFVADTVAGILLFVHSRRRKGVVAETPATAV